VPEGRELVQTGSPDRPPQAAPGPALTNGWVTPSAPRGPEGPGDAHRAFSEVSYPRGPCVLTRPVCALPDGQAVPPGAGPCRPPPLPLSRGPGPSPMKAGKQLPRAGLNSTEEQELWRSELFASPLAKTSKRGPVANNSGGRGCLGPSGRPAAASRRAGPGVRRTAGAAPPGTARPAPGRAPPRRAWQRGVQQSTGVSEWENARSASML
jgi:hypothetical protein